MQGFFLLFMLHSQEAMKADTLRQMDSAFFVQSKEKLNSVLSVNRRAYDYSELEDYALKKIRQLVVLNELDFAKDAALAMIDNNMENDEALAIYSSTTKAIERRDEQLAQLKIQEEQLAQKKQEEQQQILSAPKPPATYTPIMNVESGETFYYSLGRTGYSPLNWEVALGVADLMFATEKAENSLKYGLGINGEIFYSSDKVTFGGEIFADFMLLSFFGNQKLRATVKAVPSVSVASLSSNLFFRAGFMYDTDFMTPVIGIGYKNFGEKQISFGISADYYIGHFAYDTMKTAFSVGGAILFPLIRGDLVVMGLKLGLSDTVYLFDEGMENQMKIIFSIRVGN